MFFQDYLNRKFIIILFLEKLLIPLNNCLNNSCKDVVSFSGDQKATEVSDKYVIQGRVIDQPYLNCVFDVFDTSEDYQEMYKIAQYLIELYPSLDNDFKLSIEKFFLRQMRGEPLNYKGALSVSFFYDAYEKKDQEFGLLVNIINKVNSMTSNLKDKEYVKAREDLFNQECLILLQEVVDPEKHMNRAIQMFAAGSLPEDKNEGRVKVAEIFFIWFIQVVRYC